MICKLQSGAGVMELTRRVRGTPPRSQNPWVLVPFPAGCGEPGLGSVPRGPFETRTAPRSPNSTQ